MAYNSKLKAMWVRNLSKAQLYDSLLYVAPPETTQWYSVGRWANLEVQYNFIHMFCALEKKKKGWTQLRFLTKALTCGLFSVAVLGLSDLLGSSGLSENMSQEIQMGAPRLLNT